MNRVGKNNGIYAAETILKRRVREVSKESIFICTILWNTGFIGGIFFSGKSGVFYQMERIFTEVSIVHFTCIFYCKVDFLLRYFFTFLVLKFDQVQYLGTRRKCP